MPGFCGGCKEIDVVLLFQPDSGDGEFHSSVAWFPVRFGGYFWIAGICGREKGG